MPLIKTEIWMFSGVFSVRIERKVICFIQGTLAHWVKFIQKVFVSTDNFTKTSCKHASYLYALKKTSQIFYAQITILRKCLANWNDILSTPFLDSWEILQFCILVLSKTFIKFSGKKSEGRLPIWKKNVQKGAKKEKNAKTAKICKQQKFTVKAFDCTSQIVPCSKGSRWSFILYSSDFQPNWIHSRIILSDIIN